MTLHVLRKCSCVANDSALDITLPKLVALPSDGNNYNMTLRCDLLDWLSIAENLDLTQFMNLSLTFSDGRHFLL